MDVFVNIKDIVAVGLIIVIGILTGIFSLINKLKNK